MSAVYNEYVLSTALEHHLITEDQNRSVLAFLKASPTLSALELLYEQELLNEAQRAWFYEAIAAVTPSAPETAPPISSGPHINEYLHYGQQAGASDIHLSPETPPMMRYGGLLIPLYEGAPSFPAPETERLARAFLTPKQISLVLERGSIDFCHEIPGVARFRTSVVRQRRGWELVFRVLPAKVATLTELGLPDVLQTLTRYPNGLILVAGPAGSGKSTTLAAMVEQINRERRGHIVTLEDPVESVFESKGCQISQREIGSHTDSFAAGLRSALHEDPDVIMVGEIRDLETIQLAVAASETGHLVLGTLHTLSAPRAIDRLVDVFPVRQQGQIRAMVSESLRGIVCQQLIPRADGHGRIPAFEIMVDHPAMRNLIRDGKSFMLSGVIQTGRKQGMRRMDDSLIELYDAGTISSEEAIAHGDNQKFVAQEIARRQR